MAHELGFTPRTQKDYLKLLRKAISVGIRVATLDPQPAEDLAIIGFESTLDNVEKGHFRLYEMLNIFMLNLAFLDMLCVVYDFYEDRRSERLDELAIKFGYLTSELLDELDRKDPSTVVSHGLADKTSDERAIEPHETLAMRSSSAVTITSPGLTTRLNLLMCLIASAT
jgi:hypothetical protein